MRFIKFEELWGGGISRRVGIAMKEWGVRGGLRGEGKGGGMGNQQRTQR